MQDSRRRCRVEPNPTDRGELTKYCYERAAVVRLVGGAEPLRDDYAPVDQLETRPE
jgi:hypothetical protein